ncbi:MAG: nucleotidyltransferase domain-containing protein [Leptospiraceae bacterium]|nr:nucleotidyltransferase domain-containing protein [Leptospiraceae bacterium]
MMQDRNLEFIKAAIQNIFPVARIALFGSRAKNQETESSDYDILVILDKDILLEDKVKLRTQLRKLLVKKGILTDILIHSEKEVNLKKTLPGHIVRNAMQEAVFI